MKVHNAHTSQTPDANYLHEICLNKREKFLLRS